jgi:hypothetical protein
VDEDEMEEVEKDDDDDETEEEEDEDLDFDYGDDYDDDDEDDDGFDGYFIRPPNSNQNFVYMDDDEAYIITDEVFENEYEKDQLIVVNEPEEDIEETQQRQAEGEFHDQGDAKWIVIRGQINIHNDIPFGLAALRAYLAV